VAYSLLSNLKGLLGPAAVSVKALNPNQCTSGSVIAFVLIICTLIVEAVMVDNEGGFAGCVIGCIAGGVVESDPPNGGLTFPRPDGIDGLNLFLIVGWLIATSDRIAKDSFLDCVARLGADLAESTVEDDMTFVTAIDRPETEP